MTKSREIIGFNVRSWILPPLGGAILVCSCGNGAASDPHRASAERDQSESNQTIGDPPLERERDAQVKAPRVVGYLPTYRFAGTPLHLDSLTHLNLAFAIPDEQGNFYFPDADSSAIRRIVEEAHEAKVKVLVAIAGGDGGPVTAARLALGVEPFVTSVLELVQKYDLDGVDVDIEGDSIDPDTYGPLMRTLSARLAEFPERKLLTAAVAEYRKDRYRALGSVDFLNIMSYDQCGSWSESACEHSTLAQAQLDLDYWANLQDVDANGNLRTIGRDDVVLGVPFYGRCWGEKCPERVRNDDGTFQRTVNLTYARIGEHCANGTFFGCSSSSDVLKSGDESTGYYVTLNSPLTIEHKAVMAKNYGGIMVWELGQDDAKSSLFAGIAKVFRRSATPPNATGDAASRPDADLPGKQAPTRETAQSLLNRIAGLYQDYAAAAEPPGSHRLVGVIREDDEVPHTYAQFGEEWRIVVTPAWLAYPTMTVDLLALTSCHEMGHFVGGFPFKGTSRVEDGTASASEGQADYFATKDCLPRLWADERDSNAAAFAELDASQRELCTKTHSDLPSQHLCARALLTSLHAAQIFHKEYVQQFPSDAVDAPKLETPDLSVVSRTRTGRSNGQCRLDTLVAGIQCNVKAAGTTIPGYLPPYGTFSDASQNAARPFACQEGPGARPECWFYPDTRAFDCTEFEAPECVVENGVAAIRSCDAIDGLTDSPCFPNEICQPDADGFPSCVP
jgi:hypothetical protein